MQERRTKHLAQIFVSVTILVFTFVLMLNGLAVRVSGQDIEKPPKNSCSIPSDAVRNQDGKLKFFTSEQLLARVRKRETIKRPSNLKENNMFGVVVVNVVVDKRGRLSCIKPFEGNPFAQFAVARSLRKWVFKEHRNGDVIRSMVGVLEIPYDFRNSRPISKP
ncbi:MAG: hypothetical protein KF831_14500 [Acidobacteria bacterium]|nr:hypothetical protein [Acidobacteriota bacterium]